MLSFFFGKSHIKFRGAFIILFVINYISQNTDSIVALYSNGYYSYIFVSNWDVECGTLGVVMKCG